MPMFLPVGVASDISDLGSKVNQLGEVVDEIDNNEGILEQKVTKMFLL